MFKTQAEYTPVIIEDKDGDMALVFLIDQEEDKVRLCNRLLKTDKGLLPIEVGYIDNYNVETITKLEVKNEN